MRAALSSLVFLSACAAAVAQKSAPPVRAKEYYALEPGTVWVYKARYLGQEQTRTVVMGALHDGFFTDDAGGKFAYDGNGLRDQRRYLLKEPLQTGHSWTCVAAVGADESYLITKAGSACDTKTKHFADCVEVKSTIAATDRGGNPAGKLENTMVFARNVGLVRLQTVLVDGDKRSTQVDMELVEFRGQGARK